MCANNKYLGLLHGYQSYLIERARMSVAANNIDKYLAGLPAWQKDNMQMFRRLMTSRGNISEGWKWDVPVFMANDKLVSAMSGLKDHTKFNFFEGATLEDFHGLFNNGLDSKKHRSIDLAENTKIDERKLADLIQQAIKQALR